MTDEAGAQPGPAPAEPAPVGPLPEVAPAPPAPLHRVVTGWLVSSAVGGVGAGVVGMVAGTASQGPPPNATAIDLVGMTLFGCVLAAAALAPLEGVAALAHRLGGRRRVALVVVLAAMPLLGLLVAMAAAMWFTALEQGRDPDAALEAVQRGFQASPVLRPSQLAPMAGVLAGLLLPLGVARAWRAGGLRTGLAGAVGGLLAWAAIKFELRHIGDGPHVSVALTTVAVAAAAGLGLRLGDGVEERAARWLARRDD